MQIHIFILYYNYLITILISLLTTHILTTNVQILYVPFKGHLSDKLKGGKMNNMVSFFTLGLKLKQTNNKINMT